jgi:hypothetical protein
MERTVFGIPVKVSSFASRRNVLVIGLICLTGIAVMGCSDNKDNWLADLSNPFLGKWQSDIPSAGMTLIFDYKTDGTFDYEIPGLPADQGGKGSGGYLVNGNVMVTYLESEGAAGYIFKVVNNDTIDVTEIDEVKEGGELVLGNTAPFTRVAGSPVNKENKPFVLSNFLIGNWSALIPNEQDPEHPYDTIQEYRQDGSAQFTLLPDYVFPKAYYCVIGDVLITFTPGENEYESFVFIVNNDGTLTGRELLAVENGNRTLGVTATYNPVDPADVSKKVISASANRAGLYFLATPDTAEYAEATALIKSHGFTWATNLAVPNESTSDFVTGKTNQLTADGSGFKFSLKTNPAPDSLRAAIGFNSIFMFTAEDDNLGTTYASLVSALDGLDEYEGGWVLPEASVLTGLGIRVYTTYSGAVKDITEKISFGINVTDKANGLMFSYGAVMVDKASTSFESEGYLLNASGEEEHIWSDETADNVITADWWIGKSS